jgi:hypothetical protein
MTTIKEMERVEIKINSGPIDTAVIGSGLKNKNWEAVVLKEGCACPKPAEGKADEKEAGRQPAEPYAADPIDYAITVYQPPLVNVTDQRFPISIEVPSGTLPKWRAVAMRDKSQKGVVLVACMDDAINLIN